MRQVAVDAERKSVQTDPALHPNADGCDFILAAFALIPSAHPHADAVLAPLSCDVEGGERADHPLLERGHVTAYITPAPFEVEHRVDNPLAGAVVGELPAPASRKHRKARLNQIG